MYHISPYPGNKILDKTAVSRFAGIKRKRGRNITEEYDGNSAGIRLNDLPGNLPCKRGRFKKSRIG